MTTNNNDDSFVIVIVYKTILRQKKWLKRKEKSFFYCLRFKVWRQPAAASDAQLFPGIGINGRKRILGHEEKKTKLAVAAAAIQSLADKL